MTVSLADVWSFTECDNANDEYHTPVSPVDIWAEYARLHLLGWTQEKIKEVIGEKSQGGVSQIIKNFNTKLFNSEYQSGLTPEAIATNHNLDEAVEIISFLKMSRASPFKEKGLSPLTQMCPPPIPFKGLVRGLEIDSRAC